MRRTLLRLTLATLGGGLALAPAASAAVPQSYAAKRIFRDSISQTWRNSCTSADGRFTATATFYLKKSKRKGPQHYLWDVPRVTLQLGDLATGEPSFGGDVWFYGMRYDGDGLDVPQTNTSLRRIGKAKGGSDAFSPMDVQPWMGNMNAQWWRHRTTKEWYFDIYRLEVDFLGSGPGVDCKLWMNYGYPVNKPSNARPHRG